MLYLLEPEVAGGVGPSTEMRPGNPNDPELPYVPVVLRLEYLFDGWLGDELLTTHPCFIVTQKLMRALEAACLSGIAFEPVDVRRSEVFEQLHPDRHLPPFVGLVPIGRAHVGDDGRVTRWSGHDVCLSQRADLLVTEKALTVIRSHKLDQCLITTLL